MTTIYRLVAVDDEAFYELGHYAEENNAAADRKALVERFPGRPSWVEFRVDKVVVVASRLPMEELEDGLIAITDLNVIRKTWTDPDRNRDDD